VTISAAIKAATTTRNSTTTLTADPDLVMALSANTNYIVRLDLNITAAQVPDFKFRLDFDGTITRAVGWMLSNNSIGASTSAGTTLYTAIDSTFLNTTETVIGGSASAPTHIAVISIVLVIAVGASGGNFSFMWAQNTSDAGNTSVLAGSGMSIQNV